MDILFRRRIYSATGFQDFVFLFPSEIGYRFNRRQLKAGRRYIGMAENLLVKGNAPSGGLVFRGIPKNPTIQVKIVNLGLKKYFRYHFRVLKRLCQKSLPSSLFQREEDGSARSPIGPLFIGAFGERALPFFPLWKRGMKGDFTAFQKTKLSLLLKAVPIFA